jgi:hypothetical protein
VTQEAAPAAAVPTVVQSSLPLAAKPKASRSVGKRIALLMQELGGMKADEATDDRFQAVCGKVISIPFRQRPAALMTEIGRAFRKPPADVRQYLRSRGGTVDFDSLVPTEGWLRDYLDWTRQTEPPSVFHFFVGATVIGAALARRVVFDKGAYQVFPSLNVMLIAPTGRCRKTSAANLGISLFSATGGRSLADKTTPEALVDALKGEANALIYAPELAVFLGKQKYQEGMIPLLTALLDCPKEWTAKTIGRGDTVLVNVGLSSIMCSTVDWLQTGIPADSFGGGFMSRFIFVIQDDTPRCFPLPPPMNREVRSALLKRLAAYRLIKADAKLSIDAEQWYVSWYRDRIHSRPAAEGHFAGYYERKPDHMLRIAMILRVARTAGAKEVGHLLTLTAEDLIHAERLLSWLEDFMPGTFDRIVSSASGEDQTRILRCLRQHGGKMEHSTMLRRLSSRLNADQFRRSLQTLREAKLVEFDAASKTYFLTSEGWE